MCKNSKEKKENGFTCNKEVFFAFVLIVIGCFAPYVFTLKCDIFPYFNDKGQIGDTIGGIMGPFVAIAGVIMTFVAFRIQVEANNIQRKQLGKTFQMRRLEDKLDSRNALQLLSVDITLMISKIDAISERIDDFCEKTKENPTGDIPFEFIPIKAVGRYNTIDRNLVYNAFVLFIKENYEKEEKCLADFSDLYEYMDLYSAALENFYPKVFKPHADDIIKTKEEILQNYNKVRGYESLCELDEFKDALNDCINKIGNLDISRVREVLEDERFLPFLKFENLKNVQELPNYKDKEQAQAYYLMWVKVLRESIEKLKTQNIMFVDDMNVQKNESQKAYEDFKELNDKIKKALEKHTIESIQKEFAERT